MTSSRERVERLLTLAADPGASPQEARTAATQAWRIIQRDGLLGGGAADHLAGTTRQQARAATEPAAPEPAKDPPTPEKTAYRAGWDRVWGEKGSDK